MARASAAFVDVPLDAPGWGWGVDGPAEAEHLGRRCLAFPDAFLIAPLAGVELLDGTIELDLAVTAERAFHGVVWRHLDPESHESFFVRPHQVGNPDAIQYTPVFHGLSGWQLYHGPGFGAAVSYPIDAWFTIRVAYAGSRAEVDLLVPEDAASADAPSADPEDAASADAPSADPVAARAPTLSVAELKRPVAPGSVGIQVGGPGLRVSGFRYSGGPVTLRTPAPAPVSRAAGVVPAWLVSDPFGEPAAFAGPTLDPRDLSARTWTPLPSEPSGLTDLARVARRTDARNTVFARTVVRSARAVVKVLELGFSDRVVVYLNGQAVYRGDATYRSRDYRFLGSIGYWDALYLPLREGDNELILAVSETFGGWGVQARFPEPEGLELG